MTVSFEGTGKTFDERFQTNAETIITPGRLKNGKSLYSLLLNRKHNDRGSASLP